MKISDLFLITVMCLVIFGGAYLLIGAQEEDTENCEYPYIEYSGSCCLDTDMNRVCDFLEQNIKMQVLEMKNRDLDEKNLGLEKQLESCKQLLQMRQYQAEQNYWDDDRDGDSDEDIDITVIVIDDDTDDYVEDALVKLTNGDTEREYTDEDGEAEFDSLEEDCYEIRVSHDDYWTEEDEVCLDEDDDGDRIRVYLSYD
jgi:hypothetical protein